MSKSKQEHSAYVLTWNPCNQPDGVTEYDISRTRRNIHVLDDWSTGRCKSIVPEDRLYFYRVGTEKGLVGSGLAKSKYYLDDNWNKKSNIKLVPYVKIEWDRLLHYTDRLTPDKLARVCSLVWDQMQANGQRVPENEMSALETLWQEHLKTLGRSKISDKQFRRKPTLKVNDSLEEPDGESTYLEGSVSSVLIDRYERNSKARTKCLAHHKPKCGVCNFSFKKFYGPQGKGIHVHHLRELATIGEEYELDPIKDLIPVCPNCHAMLHSTRPAMSIEKLQLMIAKQKKNLRKNIKTR